MTTKIHENSDILSGDGAVARPAQDLDRFNFEVLGNRGVAAKLVGFLQRRLLRACSPLGSCLGRRFDEAVGILMYHRVSPVIPSRIPPYTVTPETFRCQLAGLLAKGYVAWPLNKVLQHASEGSAIPRNVFVVTFDDGYANNFLYAWPVLRDLSIPATIFIATAYLNSQTPFPFDRWEGNGLPDLEDAWKPLTNEQCEALLAGGLVDLGAHTHTHADFRGRHVDFQADLEQCLDVLRSDFGLSRCTFAFPQGRKRPGFAGEDLIAAARATGVACALTTENELVRPGDDPIGGWGRFTVEEFDSPATISARLDGWYGSIRDGYRALRGRS